jgi:hypothetical protein
MIMAALALLAGLWAGLLRLGWLLPSLSLRLPAQHGPLMVSGFLGTLISLERAVASSQNQNGRCIYYLAPLLAGLGGSDTLFCPANGRSAQFEYIRCSGIDVYLLHQHPLTAHHRPHRDGHRGITEVGGQWLLAGRLAGFPGCPLVGRK